MSTTDNTDKKKAPRRRRGRRERPTNAPLAQKPFAQPQHRFSPTEFASADEVNAIHEASLKLLQTTGINVLWQPAIDLMLEAGATVKSGSSMVCFEPELILELIKKAPSEFTMHARNPAHNVQIGGDKMSFCMMASAPNASCLDHGRRTGRTDDFQNFLKLTQQHNILHMTGGYPVEPVDIHASVRHLHCINDLLTLTDKAFCIYSLGAQRNIDAIEMVRLARGLTTEQMREQCSLWTVINTNSPLQLDIPMMQGIYEMSRMGQLVVITPFTLAGAMAPVTIAGALVQQNAEALAAIAYSQMVRPGAPVMYGGFTSNVDMKSGAPAFGTPEYMKAQLIGGQLARHYSIPYRTSNVCAANTVDAQAAYESVFSLWGAIQSGMHLLKHGAGWMEGGLCCSYEKVILDIDLLQMVQEFLAPLEITDETMALSTIDEVGPGGHFFGTDHTQARYKDAFYSPVLSDWRNFESWEEAGRPDAMQKANRVWKERLAQYEKPSMPTNDAAALQDYVERRVSEGGVATDF